MDENGPMGPTENQIPHTQEKKWNLARDLKKGKMRQHNQHKYVHTHTHTCNKEVQKNAEKINYEICLRSA